MPELHPARTLVTMRSTLHTIPHEWFEIVEPKLRRQGTCWLWQGGIDLDGEPVVTLVNLTNGKRGSRRVKRIIAEMFWIPLPSYADVVHVCGTKNCLNPEHFYVTTTHWKNEDRAAIVKKRAEGIRRYNERSGK